MLFSIILPTFNRASFLSKTIQSVIDQNYKDWELIIVDDGSDDNTKEVVANYSSERKIKYIYQENAERSVARNNGIKLAEGKFICFLDSDNYFNNNRLQSLHDVISKDTIPTCYYTSIKYTFPSGNETIKRGKFFSKPVLPNELIKEIIATPQLIIEASILKKYCFNPLLTIGEDMELLFRITQEFPLIYIEGEPTVTEIEHENRSVNQKSSSSEKQLITLDVMFHKSHPASNVSKNLQKWIKSEVLLNASYDFLIQRKPKGLKYLFLSLFYQPFSKKNNYKINLMLNYLINDTNKLKRIIQNYDKWN